MQPLRFPSLWVGIPLLLWCCASTPDGITRDPTGRLKPCPSSPNCVSTDAVDPSRKMAPLSYRGDRGASQALVLAIIRAMPRATLVTVEDHYLHVEFRSRLFGFVDDVEFAFDDDMAAIHFRSASRTGYSDLGVNRKRMNNIAEAYRRAAREDEVESGERQ